MRTVLLDSGIMAYDPRIITYRKEQVRLVVTREVMSFMELEADTDDRMSQIVALLHEARRQEYISGDDDFRPISNSGSRYQALLAIARQAKLVGQDVVIATMDPRLTRIIRDTCPGIGVFDLEDTQHLMSGGEQDLELGKKAAQISPKTRLPSIVMSLLGAIAVTFLVFSAFGRLAEALGQLLVICIVVAAFVLLQIKIRWKLIYGVVEIFFGMATIWLTPTPPDDARSLTLKVVGGFYIIASGLENVAKANHPKLRRLFSPD